MKIDCSIDGKTLTLSLNSNKPLSLILSENIGDGAAVNHCSKTGAPVSAEILAGLQLQFETGSYEDEDADRKFLNS